MELGWHARLMGGWMGSFTAKSWMMNSKEPCPITTKPQPMSSSNRTMTQSTPAKRPKLGSMTMGSQSWNGLLNPQTQPNRTSVESCQKEKRSLGSMKNLSEYDPVYQTLHFSDASLMHL